MTTIREFLATRDIKPRFSFIGIDLHPSDYASFAALVAAVDAEAALGSVRVVRNLSELERAVRLALLVEPDLRSLGQALDLLNDVAQSLDGALESIESLDFDAARARITEARQRGLEAGWDVHDLESRGADENFDQAVALARQLRELQGQMASTLERMLEHCQLEQWQALNQSGNHYNELSRAYIESIENCNELVSRIEEAMVEAPS